MIDTPHRRALDAEPWRHLTAACGLAPVVAVTLIAPHTVVVPAFIAWACLVWLRHGRRPATRRSPRTTAWLITTVFVLLTAIASLTVHPIGYQGLRLLAWFAVAVLVAGATRVLPSGPLAATALGTGAAWGAVFAGAAAVFEVGITGVWRADAFTGNAIVFGNMALVLGATAWWLMPARWVAMAAVAGALVASVLSGSRGGWLVVPWFALLAVVEYRRRGGTVPWARLTTAGLTVVAAAVVMGGGMPVDRLAAAVDDVAAYVSAEAPEPATGTSVGARFEAWRAAAAAFRDQPLLGVGWGNLGDEFAEQVDDGRRHPRIATFTHAHHHLLGALANGGMVGALAAVAVLAVPAWWCRRAWRSTTPSVRAAGGLGLTVVGGFLVFGQTEAIFDDAIALGLYTLIVGVALRHVDEADRSGQIDAQASAVPASPE